MGWALRTSRRPGTFDPKVREFLKQKFEEGEITGRKLDPRTVAKNMRIQFASNKWLKWSQIASVWSRLACLRRQETLEDRAIHDEDDNNQEHVGYDADLEDDPYFNNPEIDVIHSINEQTSSIFQAD